MTDKGIQKILADFKQNITFDSLRQGAEKVSIPSNNSDLISYPEFLKYFEEIQVITKHHLVIGINFTYSWMPTIFEFKSDKFPAVIEILNSAKQGKIPIESELITLKGCFNNSLVGTSKLLHFINPLKFAIWDSRVYRYLTKEQPYSYRLDNYQAYLAYLELCEYLVNQPEFLSIFQSMSRKVGYEITPFRAIELIMYFNGRLSRTRI
jgi:hypothetical protein